MLAVHSLSKRSNMAGFRVGFVAGDPELVRYLGEVRKHAGLMMPAPIQAAAVAALGDDEHVVAQRDALRERRALMIDGLGRARTRARRRTGARSTCGCASEEQVDDGWEIAARLAEAGHARRAREPLRARGRRPRAPRAHPADDRLELVLDRLAELVPDPAP